MQSALCPFLIKHRNNKPKNKENKIKHEPEQSAYTLSLTLTCEYQTVTSNIIYNTSVTYQSKHTYPLYNSERSPRPY